MLSLWTLALAADLALRPEQDSLHVELRFELEAARTRLSIPRSWAGQKDLDEAISELDVQGATLRGGKIKGKPGSTVTLTYTWKPEERGREGYYRGRVGTDGGYLLAPAGWWYPI